jgi:hypothetical protein
MMIERANGGDKRKDYEIQYRRFIVFAYYHYYPGGGLEDAEATFDTEEEARAFVKSRRDHRGEDVTLFDCQLMRELEL